MEPRAYRIRRNSILGYGFVAGYESPTMVKVVEPTGPSYGQLQNGDIIMAVNGIHVENAPRDQIVKMIQLCDEIDIKVRQPTYDELIKAKNLADPKFYALNKANNQSPANNYPNHRDTSTLPPTQSPLNRLVTSISQQHQQQSTATTLPSTPNSSISNDNQVIPQVPIKNSTMNILRSKFNNSTLVGHDNKNTNGVKANDKSHDRFGRHSPIPQRCKSSIDGTQTLKLNRKSSNGDNDQPMLKRSNTMRPMKPPTKVLEIFETVIKIFFEDGTNHRCLTYNQDTTVGSTLETLNARLAADNPYYDQIKRYFGLALTVGVNSDGVVQSSPQLKKPKEQRRKILHILDENDSIMKIRQLPYAPLLRLVYRMVYPPADVSKLYAQSKVAFEYLYQQSCNDLKLERFSPELDSDTALKLGALHLLEYVYTNHSKEHGNSKDPKVYLKLIKKTPGLQFFLPASMVENLTDKKNKYKKLRIKLMEHMKKNFEEYDFEPPKVKSNNRYTSASFHELSLPEKQSSPSDCVKLVFLNYISQLPCYGNAQRPVRSSTSPVEGNSAGECSSSLESVPRTSDSSPLIRQDCNQNSQTNHVNRMEQPAINISRIAQMNSMRSLSSSHTPSICQLIDQPDAAQTPSLDSISSITFNMQSSPSPQQTGPDFSQTIQAYPRNNNPKIEPCPMPRQQFPGSKLHDYNSIEKIYNQRYTYNERSLEDLLRNAIMPPPPPPSMMFDHLSYHPAARSMNISSANHMTQVLSDQDIDRLRVPPPPKIFN